MLPFDTTETHTLQPFLISFKATIKTTNLFENNKKNAKTYFTFPPHKWHLSPIQPGLHLHSPLFESQMPFEVQGWRHIIGSGVVAMVVSTLS